MIEIGRMGSIALLLLPALCFVVAACASGGSRGERSAVEPVPELAADPEPAVDPEPATVVEEAGVERRVGAADNGARVELSRADVLVVSLESNPSTGYGWRVASCDESVLRLDGEPAYVQGGAPGLVGAGGVETLRLRPVGPGETNVELAYVRPWEQGVAPVRSYVLRVTVRD